MRLIGVAVSALLAMPLATPTSAQFGTPAEVARIRDAAPSCKANPELPYIGRVSGGTRGHTDWTRPVSFVGCFATLRGCEAWKGRASAIISTPLVQYSCSRR
ncbi:hypothetical protein [Acuticoccus sp.]|uniref:hypothetical protein n=1 Tax=Acuticoccus sp. TaxID=1904378 RepID=UPI003B529D99